MESRSGIWPGRVLGPAPTLREINVVCWGLLLALLAGLFLVVESRNRHGQLLQGFDADFVYFYSMGRMLNEYPLDRLYDYELQKRICTEVHPLTSGAYGPIPYPPYVGILFQPLARMSYPAAYLLWLCVSLILYIAGLRMVCARLCNCA